MNPYFELILVHRKLMRSSYIENSGKTMQQTAGY